ncbi:four-helix bundle copper-binding protein [Pullulanibacillus sp. KACC 23026]|uniref:four-helix bundle copper-binding protein n=1 Tax=Pullulanibacillus sp. KACC 23026 TaxID=3028315 RepID=UPI0023AFA12E|nr:four-helix bundle copper-binding protein [Pullulanibacillus sp. KACC 23026]WEG13731.1 four-helix bundle copper-binding protein [Pullulanibacillus sp. KACC 23026]
MLDDFRKSHMNERLFEKDYKETVDQTKLIQIINHCSLHCDEMITYLLDQEQLGDRRRQLKLLRDCSSICGFTASHMAAQSFLTPSLIKLCAYTCEHCGRECGQFEDPMSVRCSKVCLTCARYCQEASV